MDPAPATASTSGRPHTASPVVAPAVGPRGGTGQAFAVTLVALVLVAVAGAIAVYLVLRSPGVTPSQAAEASSTAAAEPRRLVQPTATASVVVVPVVVPVAVPLATAASSSAVVPQVAPIRQPGRSTSVMSKVAPTGKPAFDPGI